MAAPSSGTDGPLRVLHVLRAPLGGLFRHVMDLTREQVRRGHAVGLIADADTGGTTARDVLAAIEPSLALGLSRVPMRRAPHPSDLKALGHALERMRHVRPDVVHGHGSKGGAFSRVPGFLPGGGRPVRVYTPHGGSLNHRSGTAANRFYMGVERLLVARTDLLLFESAFIAERYRALVGSPRATASVVHNGIGPDEFVPVAPRPDAADFLYVGELRAAKGIDLLLEALAQAGRIAGRDVRAVLVGSGPDEAALMAHARRLGLEDRIAFTGPMRAREAFALGRVLVVPSRAESLPYIALEAAAARVPLIATDVGGIPEIFGPFRSRLVPSENVARLTGAMVQALSLSRGCLAREAGELAAFVRDRFSMDAMVDGVIGAYRDALARKVASASARPGRGAPPLLSRARS